MKNARITATDIYRYIQCPHWPFYERFATPVEKKLKRKITEGEEKRMENGVLHELEVVEERFSGQEIVEVPFTRDAEKDFAATLAVMKKGARWIYQGTLLSGDLTGRPDLLERREGASALGGWYYVPVDVKSSHEIQKYQKLQLAFYAKLLDDAQGRYPDTAAIINIDRDPLPFDPAGSREELEDLLERLRALCAGDKPAPVLRKTCFDTGVWGEVCKKYAEKTNDIALLFNVSTPKLEALRSLGVKTVDDAADMDPDALAGAAKGLTLHGLDTIKRQAISLKTKEVIIRKPVEITTLGLEIHFDIESDPPNDRDYLYGFLIRHPSGEKEYTPFVAESLEQEGTMWRSFLAWLETLPPEYTVYHFAPYETSRLRVMIERYGGSHWLDLFMSRMVDLKEIFIHSITIPEYFYGLKYICRFLGFDWRSDVASGGASVDAFEKYLETGDRAILDSIILYNEDDVRATEFLLRWLETYAREVTSYEKPYPWK